MFIPDGPQTNYQIVNHRQTKTVFKVRIEMQAAKEKAAAAQRRKEERDEQMRLKILDANR